VSSVLAIAMLATAATAKKTTSSSSSYFIILLLVGFGALYFLVLRPRQQRQRQTQAQHKKAEIGDEVQTVGGLIGTIVAEDGDRITISTGPGHELTYLRQAIARKIPPPDPVEPDHDADASHLDGATSNGAAPDLPAGSPTGETEVL
jgi:preprotein translocase subunit YajC